MVHIGNLVHTGDGATGGATFLGQKLAADIGYGVLFQRNSGIPALLGTVVHQSVLADVEIASAGAAAPVIRLAIGNVVLEPVHSRIALFFEQSARLQFPAAVSIQSRVGPPFAKAAENSSRP